MATQRVIRDSKLEAIFPEFSKERNIKKGSTSVITQHPIYDSMVFVYTTDKAKVDWFESIRNKVNFKFISKKREGSVYDEEPKEIYKFQIKKMVPLSKTQEKYINKHIISVFSKKVTKEIAPFLNESDELVQLRRTLKGFQPNMKFFKMAKFSKDKKIKDMMYRLKDFVEKNMVATDIRLDSFMQLPNGDIVCTDPFYSTKEV